MCDFWCSKCSRYCDSGTCLSCPEYTQILIKKICLLEDLLLYFKDIYDNCEDPDPVKCKVRLNMASAFDSAFILFDDVFNDNSEYKDINNMISILYPEVLDLDQFEVEFFDNI